MAELYQPTLVIGLGGTGKNIILALKKMIAENCEHGMADFPFLELISLDTDEAIGTEKSLIKTIKDEELTLNRNQEIFKLHTNFGNVPNLEEYPEIHEWFPDSLRSHLTPAALAIGASQKKPVGRFTFAWNAKDLYERINRFMSAPVDAIVAKGKIVSDKLSHNLNVFICGSICGGTGAGTFLDVAYLVRYIAGQNNGNGFTVRIFGMFALASLFDGIRGTEKVRRNCYASLVELDNFMNDINFSNPYRCFYPAYRNFSRDYEDSSKNKPFDYPFLFDNFGKGVALNSQGAFSEMAARFIYLLTGHELGTHWTSMYNNVMANLEINYKNLKNKDIHYSGMGTFSILYPKRMIVQLCAYNLSKEYLKKILDDSYAPQEIEQLAKNFLKETKMNPLTTQLEDSFDVFETQDYKGSFKDYIENSISDFEEQSSDTDKKDLKEELLHWKNDIDEKIVEFRNLNSTRAQKVRESFLAQFSKKLELLLDLHEHKLGVKKNSDGTDFADRGSLVRAENFVETLIKIFTEAKDKYRRTRNDAESTMKNLNGDFETALSDFDEITDSIFATKKKIASAKEKVLDVCRDLFNAQKQNFIADWCYQLFTDILWNDVPKYDGLIKELEQYKNKYRKVILTFKEIDKDINKFLNDNRHFETNPLFAIIFDYEKDVEESYKKLLAEKSEEFIFGELSDSLTEVHAFGKDYISAATKTASLVNIDILNAAEKFFFEPVNKINIADRILDTPEVCERLEQGTYFETTPIYLGVEEMVMNRECLSFKDSTFFAISIPDEYEGKPCKDISGIVRGNGINRICPMEQDPEKYQKEPCPMFNHCLKQKLLHHAPSNVAITPTSEISEVNIMHSIAGYPLYSLSSVMNNCKSVYVASKLKQQKENEENGTDYEEINMFGPLQFDDLNENSVDPRKLQNEFRKLLIVAYIARRLKVQSLSVDFVTERDITQNRKDKPGLHLGNSMNEVMVRFQSSRLKDKKDIEQFKKETELLIEDIKKDSETKETFEDWAKESYAKTKNELPAGFVQDDLDLMNEVVYALCGITLIEKRTIGSRLG